MERIIIEDIYDVAEMMYGNATDGNETTFIGLYDDVAEVLRVLPICCDDGIDFIRIDLEPVELDGYDREYYVSLNEDMELWCCKAYDYEHECYLFDETDVLYIADDCNSKILERIDYEHAVEVTYEDDEPECDKDHVEETRVAVDDNGVVRGFEKSWTSHENGMTYKTTYTHYSNNQDMLKQLMENFNIKY
jgi:hypothetical protein